MISVINPPYSARNLPPLSALLLLFAALFVVAAWRFSKLDENRVRPASPVELAPPAESPPPTSSPARSASPADPELKHITVSDSNPSEPVYRPQRHQAVSLGGSTGADRAASRKSGPPAWRRAIL